MERAPLPWNELMQLQVVRRLSAMLGQRFGVGMGFVDADGDRAQPPASGPCSAVQSQGAGKAACLARARQAAATLAEQHARGDLPPRPVFTTCVAGLTEIAAPIVLGQRFRGCLLAGGFVIAERADAPAESGAHPRLSPAEAGFLADLIGLCADEIVAVERERGHHAPRGEAGEREGGPATRYSYDAIIGRSRPMQELYRTLDKVIDSDATVLIQGENGTGKELIAHAIHANSPRRSRRFVVQNCSAMNDNLLDSELFGHRKGAFTGAVVDKLGLFEVADGGTFFLDEIGDTSPALQVKLLRVLQEGTFMPVGDTAPRRVDVRIIAATNRDLRKMVDAGAFREDLYYRVNVINITAPPLRERRDDMAVLVDHFLKKHARSRRGGVRRLSRACLDRLLAHGWPGNVRELENEIERLVVLAGDERVIGEELLSPRLRQEAAVRAQGSLPEAVEALERRLVREALGRHRGNKTRAARELGISRRNLIRMVQKWGA